MLVHASCVARDGRAVLITGPSGAGKSDLALRLISRGFVLVADDRVELGAAGASPPTELAGLLEVRGLGILRLPYRAPVLLALALALGPSAERLPARLVPAPPPVGVPTLPLDPWEAAATEKAQAAFSVATGAIPSVAGAFA